jgi:uncharacterized Zn finger protein
VIRYRCDACASFRRNRVTSVIRYPTNTTIFRCQTACGHVRPWGPRTS